MKKLFFLFFIVSMTFLNNITSYGATENVFNCSTIFPIGDSKIRMMSENTYADLYKRNVSSEYILKNETGSKQTLQVGALKDFNGNTIITDISVLVNNKKITSETKLVNGEYVYVFDVSFLPNEYKKINLVYSGKLDETTDKVTYNTQPLSKWQGTLIKFKYTVDLGNYLKPEVSTYVNGHSTYTDKNTYVVEYAFEKPDIKIDSYIQNNYRSSSIALKSREIYQEGKSLDAFLYIEEYLYKNLLKKSDTEYNNRKPYDILDLFEKALSNENMNLFEKNSIYREYMNFYLIEYYLGDYSNPKYDKQQLLDIAGSGWNGQTFISQLSDLNNTEANKLLKDKIICIDPGHQKNANLEQEPLFPGSKETKPKVAQGGGSFTFNQIIRYLIKKSGGQPDDSIYSETSDIITESQINLDIAQFLSYRLQALGATVIMTRAEDNVNISNKERAEIANAANVDLTIRIHCDSSTDPTVSGISVQTPAIKNISKKEIYNVSKLLAQNVLDSIIKNTEDKNRGVVERDDLVGFNWAEYPTVLIECGFLSNPDWPFYSRYFAEGTNYDEKMVDGIIGGIEQYFQKSEVKSYYKNHHREIELRDYEKALSQLKMINNIKSQKVISDIKDSDVKNSDTENSLFLPLLFMSLTILGAIIYLVINFKHIFGKH